MYPPLLEQRGLVEALNAAALRSPIAVKVSGAAVARYSAEVETAVYFCCLEALQNAAKHAGATEALIGLDGTDGLVVTIEDDGKGFDPALVEGGQGLTNMSDRVGATGGVDRDRVGAVSGNPSSADLRHDERKPVAVCRQFAGDCADLPGRLLALTRLAMFP